MMRDLAPLDGRRTNLNRTNPPSFGEARRHHGLVPGILGHCALRIGRRFDDQIRWATENRGEVPDTVVCPLDWWRHVLRVALRRASVDPANDSVDLFVAQ